MSKICSIIDNSRSRKRKRRVNFISSRKLKFYTKEALKIFNITLIAFGFIIAIIYIKYKPMYEVKISGEGVGYIDSKEDINKMIEEDIENYEGKNIDKVELIQKPEYELKLVEKTREENKSEILVAMQKEVEITYKYYEIKKENNVLEKVDSLETAERLINEIQQSNNEELLLTIQEQITKDENEIKTNNIEVAKENITEKLKIEMGIANINGIKISALPVSGKISSRYGAVSNIRSSAHTGLDISAPKGTPIKAAAGGTVVFASQKGSYGNLVKIDHGNGVESWYAHTSKMYVEKGQEVNAGDTIATVGSTGNSTGPHLHLEIRINDKHVNPQKYLYNIPK